MFPIKEERDLNSNQNNNRGKGGGNKRNMTAIVSILLWALVLTLLVNLATQLGLHLVIGSGFVTLASSFPFYLLVLLPAEAVIFAVEAAAYAFLLKGGQTRGRRVLYALAANAASFAAGFFSLQPVLSLLKQL